MKNFQLFCKASAIYKRKTFFAFSSFQLRKLFGSRRSRSQDLNNKFSSLFVHIYSFISMSLKVRMKMGFRLPVSWIVIKRLCQDDE